MSGDDARPCPHTPGPWEVTGATLIWSPIAAATIGAASELRATNVVAYSAPRVGSPNLREVAANARLMAAAPEMLELLTAYAAPDLTVRRQVELDGRVMDLIRRLGGN